MDQNKVLRSAVETLESKVAKAEKLTEEDIYIALATEAGQQARGGMGLQDVAAISADRLERSDDNLSLGKAIFRRWNRTLHDFVCSPSDDDEALQVQVMEALAGKGSGVALIAGVLVSAFGLHMLTATLIASLVMRLFAEPVKEEVCDYWTTKLSENP